uniref:Large ribosomal subunit protein uL2m n=2 Tax=Amborella trichopoda TaxID=13333 RepID=A0A3G1HHU3_AMBTC|nr:ribosomal protein L2 [Amborella trichopoda]
MLLGRALRQFTLSTGKSAGRNSSGRITVFHRGGGSKRLQRRIDLKRSTSSMGIVERIEYDPNRSSRIALVRWIEGVLLRRQRRCNAIEEFAPPRQILEPTTATIGGLFSFSSLPGKVDQRKVACFSPGLMAAYYVVGLPTRVPPTPRSESLEASTEATSSRFPAQEGGIRKADHYIGILGNANYKTTTTKSDSEAKPIGVEASRQKSVARKKIAYIGVGLPTRVPPWSKSQACAGSFKSCAKDVFFSAFSSPKAKGETATYLSFGSSFCFPRIAVAGAKPAFFAPRMREKVRGKKTFSLCEVRKWRTHSVLWAHRIKRKAALSWQSSRRQETLGLVGAAEHNESKPKADQGSLLPSQVLACALLRGRPSYQSASRSFVEALLPVEASRFGSLPAKPIGEGPKDGACKVFRAPVTYILASHQLEVGKMVMNCDWSKPSTSGFLRPAQNAHTYLRFKDLVRTANKGREGGSQQAASWPRPPAYRYDILSPYYQVGNCIPLADIRIGTWVHDIECHPGQGAKLARAAGTFAKIMKEPAPQCLVRLPSGVSKVIDSRCRATIGIVSNPNHGARKLRKAGQSRWLGRRPIVRGVAMNPVDHPHGGGEGRTKGGRPSVSPWGKPTKAGFRTVVGKRIN